MRNTYYNYNMYKEIKSTMEYNSVQIVINIYHV